MKVVVKLVVILVVLTPPIFRFSLPISQLMAKAIPVRGARFRKACLRAQCRSVKDRLTAPQTAAL
ncbi:hypothetical protein [Salmonella bongori]|uniref:hypothetical protein n=1 Tax=Salmonella bongori TaxID=54736 RepID=UPI0009A9E2EE|nr:hypothetical protein [Salmonella bongori]